MTWVKVAGTWLEVAAASGDAGSGLDPSQDTVLREWTDGGQQYQLRVRQHPTFTKQVEFQFLEDGIQISSILLDQFGDVSIAGALWVDALSVLANGITANAAPNDSAYPEGFSQSQVSSGGSGWPFTGTVFSWVQKFGRSAQILVGATGTYTRSSADGGASWSAWQPLATQQYVDDNAGIDPATDTVLREWTDSNSDVWQLIISFSSAVLNNIARLELRENGVLQNTFYLASTSSSLYSPDGNNGVYVDDVNGNIIYGPVAVDSHVPTLNEHLTTKLYVDQRPIFETFARSGPLVVVNGKGRFRFPVAGTIIGWSAAVNTAPTGSGIGLRLNRNGTSLDTGTIAAAANALAQRPLSQTVAAGNYVTVDITSVGSTTPGEDLTVVLAWRPS